MSIVLAHTLPVAKAQSELVAASARFVKRWLLNFAGRWGPWSAGRSGAFAETPRSARPLSEIYVNALL